MGDIRDITSGDAEWLFCWFFPRLFASLVVRWALVMAHAPEALTRKTASRDADRLPKGAACRSEQAHHSRSASCEAAGSRCSAPRLMLSQLNFAVQVKLRLTNEAHCRNPSGMGGSMRVATPRSVIFRRVILLARSTLRSCARQVKKMRRGEHNAGDIMASIDAMISDLTVMKKFLNGDVQKEVRAMGVKANAPPALDRDLPWVDVDRDADPHPHSEPEVGCQRTSAKTGPRARRLAGDEVVGG
jgi:hypothetical protein